MSASGQSDVTVLAIDPGRAKCGIAIVSSTLLKVLEHAVVPTDRLVIHIATRLKTHPEISRLLIGNGTNSQLLARTLKEHLQGVPIELRDEHGTSQRARERYCAEHKGTLWAKLLPRSLRYPETDYDDYAAIIIAEDYFAAKAADG